MCYVCVCACVHVYTVYVPCSKLLIIVSLLYGTQNYSLSIQADRPP